MRSDPVGGWLKLAFIVAAGIVLVFSLTACDPNAGTSAKSSASPAVVVPLPPRGGATPTPQGGQNVSPGKDPNPQAYAAIPVTAECAWSGYRWFKMTAVVNETDVKVDFPEMRFDEDGETSRSKTFEAHPGDAITLDCSPMRDESTSGAVQCKLTSFSNILQPAGYQRKQAGSAHCYALLPRRA